MMIILCSLQRRRIQTVALSQNFLTSWALASLMRWYHDDHHDHHHLHHHHHQGYHEHHYKWYLGLWPALWGDNMTIMMPSWSSRASLSSWPSSYMTSWALASLMRWYHDDHHHRLNSDNDNSHIGSFDKYDQKQAFYILILLNCSDGFLIDLVQVSVEALISVSGKVYYSSKTKKIFLTRCQDGDNDDGNDDYDDDDQEKSTTAQKPRRFF